MIIQDLITPNMGYHRFIARLAGSTLKFNTKVHLFMNAVLTGFWLGIMGGKSLDKAADIHYKNSKKYNDDSYNMSGLFRWEKAAIEKYFSKAKNILLLAAGGGRETVALIRMGYEVDSYECNMGLVEYGNDFLRRNGVDNRIKYLPEDSLPEEVKKYDGIIFGWGAYSHMSGSGNRIGFLQKLKPFLGNEAPLMISFLLTGERTVQDRIVKSVSNFFRIFRRNKIETGDWLHSGFVHYFTEEETKDELVQAGYNVIGFNSVDYGSLVASISV